MNTFKWLKVINPLIGLSFLIQAGTSVAMIFGFRNEWIGKIHVFNGIIFIILALTHLGLNWGWVKANFFKKRTDPSPPKTNVGA